MNILRTISITMVLAILPIFSAFTQDQQKERNEYLKMREACLEIMAKKFSDFNPNVHFQGFWTEEQQDFYRNLMEDAWTKRIYERTLQELTKDRRFSDLNERLRGDERTIFKLFFETNLRLDYRYAEYIIHNTYSSNFKTLGIEKIDKSNREQVKKEFKDQLEAMDEIATKSIEQEFENQVAKSVKFLKDSFPDGTLQIREYIWEMADYIRAKLKEDLKN